MVFFFFFCTMKRRYVSSLRYLHKVFVIDKLLKLHEDLMARLIELSTSSVFVAWGGPACRWNEKRFEISPNGKYETIDGIDICGVEARNEGLDKDVRLVRSMPTHKSANNIAEAATATS